MGCKKSKINIKPVEKIYNIDKPKGNSYVQIYLKSNDEYGFFGILSPDIEFFYLVFRKEDEDRLPVAIPFEISDNNHICNQYQFLKIGLDMEEIPNNIYLEYKYEKLSNYYLVDITPRFPFAIEIYGSVHLKN
jgi:hypothetical protein